MSEWKEIEIEEGLIEIIDYRGKTPPKSDDGIPLISAANVKNGNLDFSKKSFINKENYERLATRGFIKPNDIIITTEAPAGEIALLPNDQIYQLSRRVMAMRADEKLLHHSFLYFALLNPRTKARLLTASRGSTVPRVLKTDITKFKIQIPEYSIQIKIGDVLGAYKEKIDLLHRQNKTLEAMAETLFRQWFVEEVKDDWKKGVVGDLFQLQRGFDLPKRKRSSGAYPIFAASGYSGTHNEYKVEPPGITTGRSGKLGNVFYITDNFWPLNTSLYIKEFKKSTPIHAFFLLKNIDLLSFNAGSAVPTLNRNHLHAHSISIPPQKLIQDFENLTFPIFQKIKSNQTQIKTLESLRDTLLPKLMSGAITIKT